MHREDYVHEVTMTWTEGTHCKATTGLITWCSSLNPHSRRVFLNLLVLKEEVDSCSSTVKNMKKTYLN